MSAGLPGLGLGGLFFIAAAILAPLIELVRLARGTSSPDRRRQVARQFAVAVTMIVAVDLTLRAVLLAAAGLGAGVDSSAAEGALVLPLTPIGVTGAGLAVLLVSAKGLELALRGSARSATRHHREPDPTERRRGKRSNDLAPRPQTESL